MAYCLDSYELVKCPECAAKVAYNEKDIYVSTANSYDLIFAESKNITKRIIRCPKCYKYIEVERLEPLQKKEKKVEGVQW